MSEPLTRGLAEIEQMFADCPPSPEEWWALETERDTLRAQLEALEKQHAADLEAQQAAMLQCIREERVSKQVQLEACKKVAGEFRMAVESQGKDVAALRAQLEWCESERNAARARCEQLEHENAELNFILDGADTKTVKRCEQLERELDLEKDRFADLLARTHDAETRCGQLEAALRDILERWPDIAAIRKIATAALENSTIASESTG